MEVGSKSTGKCALVAKSTLDNSDFLMEVGDSFSVAVSKPLDKLVEIMDAAQYEMTSYVISRQFYRRSNLPQCGGDCHAPYLRSQ